MDALKPLSHESNSFRQALRRATTRSRRSPRRTHLSRPHTGAYANAYYQEGRSAELARLVAGAERAKQLGLVVNAGHGINYQNITEVCTIPHLHELNIGHSIISRALMVGITQAVTEMKNHMLPTGSSASPAS